MKSLKEKKLLVKWARAMNEPIDSTLVEEVERYELLQKEIVESVKQNTIKDLFTASVVIEEPVRERLEYPKPPTLDELLGQLEEEKQDELVQTHPSEEPPVAEKTEPSAAPTLAERAAEHITKEVKLEENADSFQQPDPTLVNKNLDHIVKKLKFLEQAIGKIAAHGPGSGEVNLKFLDDVNTKPYNLKDPILRQQADGLAVVYNAANNKFELSAVASGNVSGAANVAILDEGLYLTNTVTSINFTGTGVTSNANGNNVTVNIPRYYVTTADTAPANPQDGELWYNTSNATILLWLVENNTGQWVDINDGAGIINKTTTLVTSNTYTVTSTDEYVGVNYAGPVTITIPSSSNSGRIIFIKDESSNCSNNPITITGSTVDNDATGAILQINNGSLQLLYRSGWRII